MLLVPVQVSKQHVSYPPETQTYQIGGKHGTWELWHIRTGLPHALPQNSITNHDSDFRCCPAALVVCTKQLCTVATPQSTFRPRQSWLVSAAWERWWPRAREVVLARKGIESWKLFKREPKKFLRSPISHIPCFCKAQTWRKFVDLMFSFVFHHVGSCCTKVQIDGTPSLVRGRRMGGCLSGPVRKRMEDQV